MFNRIKKDLELPEEEKLYMAYHGTHYKSFPKLGYIFGAEHAWFGLTNKRILLLGGSPKKVWIKQSYDIKNLEKIERKHIFIFFTVTLFTFLEEKLLIKLPEHEKVVEKIKLFSDKI